MLIQNNNQVFKFELFVLLIITTSFFILNEATAQVYSFDEIRESFIKERSQTGNDTIRKDCFGSIDDLILGTYPPLHPDARDFFENMMKKTLLEIQLENVTEGTTIWQIYNHGFVVKTPSMILGFDLYDYFHTDEFLKLANILDVYFISHAHGDHFSQQLISLMKAKNKPVVGPAEWDLPSIKMSAGDSLLISGLSVVAHFGLHSVPVRQFEVITPEGLKLLHTGDNQTSATLPDITDVDVMMLNAWINEGGGATHVEGVRIAINKIKPKVTLPGHILELGHLGGYIVSYRDALESDDGSLASLYYVLGWGEGYHFDNSSNDSIRPNIVENLSYQLKSDSINFTWDQPQAAEDGDSACFYRIIIENKDELFTTNRQYKTFKEIYNFKVYCYDDCGNQSESYAEYEILAAPELIEPAHWQEIPAGNPTFRWQSVDGATSYQVQISTEKVFDQYIIDSVTVTQNTFTSNRLKEGTTYFWRVRAIRVSIPGYWSSVYRFRMSGINITDRLVAHYPLDGSPADSVGDSHGTLMGNVRETADRFGKADLAYSFDGNGDYIIFPESEAFTSIDRQITISAWVYPISLAFETGVLLRDRFWRLFLGENGSVFGNIFNEVEEEQRVGSSAAASLKTWSLVAFTYDGQSINVYLNGEHGGEMDHPAARIGEARVQSSPVLGKGFGNSQNDFNGSIDEVRVYDRALSQEEIGALYQFTSSIDTRHNESNLPTEYLLAQNYPNPFNPTTTIRYELPEKSHVILKIYDVLGRESQMLVNDQQKQGRYSVTFDASKLVSGIYFYKLQAGSDFVEIKKMLLLR